VIKIALNTKIQRVRIRVSWDGATGLVRFQKAANGIAELLLNACEVVPAESGQIDVGYGVWAKPGNLGSVTTAGIAEAVRSSLF